jgi:hypothetical protein
MRLPGRDQAGAPFPHHHDRSPAMSLKDQISDDMKTAMRAKDSERLGTIRLLLSAMQAKVKWMSASRWMTPPSSASSTS